MPIKKDFKANTLIYFTFGITTLGIIMILGASIFIISTLKSTPPDILGYLITAKFNNSFDWVYSMIILGNIFAISGLIFLIYMVSVKRDYRKIILLNEKLHK
jgi:hypothetical protein